MKPERLQQVERLYHAALEHEDAERELFLQGACAGDEPLRREVESLLAHDKEDFIESPALEAMAKALAKVPIDGGACLPTTIGRYQILRLLGEGGMGMVYEAEQEQPRRTVALKVIKPGFAGPELLRRFEQESQTLGRLQHPGIAQIYEAGTADSGFGPQPYFAMELIRGESLLQYAEAHQLNTRQRLELMAKVCEAVHHAHERGIIHRDLKPSNILVDESGQPKVLDFGVARATNSDAQVTRQTDMGQLVGTLAYMSPEQLLADPLELDTRSDVYALGVILFELLAGRLPYQVGRQMHEAVQTIREEDPMPLSSVSRTYRGDIETIVGKALEKEKARRYASAAGMAADIHRYFREEPIAAMQPSAMYQLQKFARRHKAVMVGVAAVFAVLIAGIVASTWEAKRARQAERVATTEAATTEAVNDFLQKDLLAQASASNQARPDTKPDPDLKVRTALDRAAARIEDKFKGQPLVEASIRQTMGNTYRDLGLYSEAQRQLERVLDLRRRVLGEEQRDTLGTMNDLAGLYTLQGKYEQAEPLFTKVLGVSRRVLGEEHPDTLNTMNDAAELYQYQGKYEQAEPLFAKVLEVRRRALGKEHPDTLDSMNNMAGLYTYQGKYDQAEPLFVNLLDVERRVLGDAHPHTLNTMNNLAELYRSQGKYTQAEPLSAKVLEEERQVLGEEHPETLISMSNLALLYAVQGKYAQAEPLSTKVVDVSRRVLGEEHPDTLTNMNNLAVLYQNQGRYVPAEQLFNKVMEMRRRVLGKEHPDTLLSIANLARLYQLRGKYEQAEPLFARVLEVRRRVLGVEHPYTLNTTNDLAALYVNQGKYAHAEAILRPALKSYQKTTTNTWGRYNCTSLLGASLVGQQKYAEAEPLLLSGYEGMLQREGTIPAASRFRLGQAGKWIVQLYQVWRKPEKATEWRKKLHLIPSTARTH
jgi:tetratricopeptide (TPR) repeat protein